MKKLVFILLLVLQCLVGFADCITLTIMTTGSQICYGDSNGSATVMVSSGGIPPYSYEWSTNATTQTVTGLAVGWYTVTVTDSTGTCTGDTSFLQSGFVPIIISLSSTATTCDTCCDGTATVVPTGPPPVTYLWDVNANNQTTATAFNLCAGQYCVTVTDANNCTYDTCVSLPVGIIEYHSTEPIVLYPNPTSGKFRVQGAKGEIQIFDLFGRLVLRTNKEQIDMSSYPAGVYVWQVGNARGKLVLN